MSHRRGRSAAGAHIRQARAHLNAHEDTVVTSRQLYPDQKYFPSLPHLLPDQEEILIIKKSLDRKLFRSRYYQLFKEVSNPHSIEDITPYQTEFANEIIRQRLDEFPKILFRVQTKGRKKFKGINFEDSVDDEEAENEDEHPSDSDDDKDEYPDNKDIGQQWEDGGVSEESVDED